MANMAYISDFLSRMEGGRQLRGYIPCYRISDNRGKNYIGPNGTAPLGVEYPITGDPSSFRSMGASGVTIATGCDLGQTDASTLARYGLRQDIVNSFRPWLGIKKADALAALYAKPLRIDEATAIATDIAVHNGYLSLYVRPAWEKASGHSFDEQPDQAQAVIMSVCFQKGCGGVRRDWPKLWRFLATRDWYGASRELINGFVKYKKRRASEGRLLAKLCGR